MKKCTDCKKTLDLAMFGTDRSRKDGICRRCKTCNRLHVKGFAKYEKQERDPSVTPGQLINKMTGFYVPASGAYYRNDGLKHIQSRGF